MQTTTLRISLLSLACFFALIVAGCSPSTETAAGGSPSETAAPSDTPEASAASDASADIGTDDSTPKLKIDSRKADLGLVDPSEEVAHEFTIRNVGKAPVKMAKGNTSCSCTMTELPQGVLQPGESVRVRVASKIEQNSGSFDHKAEVLTDDPANRVIIFEICGTLKTILGASPESIIIWNAKPTEENTHYVTVFSEVWNAFDLEEITLTEGWTYTADPAPAKKLEEMEARSGYNLSIRPPADFDATIVSASLALRAVPVIEGEREPDQSRELSVPISVKVKPRAEFSHRKMWGETLKLGNFVLGEEVRETLILKIRDEETEMNVLEIQSEPSFLQVEVEPATTDTSKGLYLVRLTIPSDAAPCSYRGEKLGSIKLITDHPNAPEIELPINFAISSL